jgi:hypothetical protein
MQAFMQGRIRVQGDMMKLMAMQAAMPANDASEQVADEIAGITAPAEPPALAGEQPDDDRGDD